VKVPLLDLKAQLQPLSDEIHAAVAEVINSTTYIMGPKVEELEQRLAEYCGVKHCIGVSSGTDALLVGLMALEIKPGDIVITTPYSFFASAGVVARLGGTPMLVEIDSLTFNMDPEALRQWFVKNSDKISRVKAIIPVHLFGQAANMDPIMEIARQYGIPVIEDTCQAIGTTYPSKNGTKVVGGIGLMGSLSFFPSKNLGGIGDGGMVTCNDDAFADKVRKLRNHGAHPKYYHSLIGGNFRLDPIQAAVLLVKLPHLNNWHSARRDNAHYYDENLHVPGLAKPNAVYGRQHHIYNQYVVTVPNRRDELRNFLNQNNIGNEVYYPVPFHLQECFQYLGYKQGDFVKSEHGAQHSIALPIYPELTHEMQDQVIAKIVEFYSLAPRP